MSTTIKPLDIYVGDVKVFPDVNLNGVGNPITETDTFEEMTAWYNMISREQVADVKNLYVNEYGWTRYVTPIFMPVVEEADDSPWHTKETMSSNFWDFEEMNTLYEVPFAIDPKWLKNDWYGSRTFAYCDKLKTISFDLNKSAAPFIMKDTDGNVVLKTEANLGSLFSGCGQIRSITGLVINDIQDFTYDTNYIQNGVYLLYDDNNVRAGYSEYVGDANEFTIETYNSMFSQCNYLTTLDVTFPSVLHTNDISNMFLTCRYLPDDQFPTTLNLEPLNPNRNININASFAECNLLEHVPITEASWQYVQNANSAFGSTKVHTVDIPANATHLDNIGSIMSYHNNDGGPDELIIRTTSLMTKYKNGEIGDPGQLIPFNPADYYNGDDPDWRFYFNMYVPDSQFSDWADFFNNITDTERGQGTWFSDRYLQPVSGYGA